MADVVLNQNEMDDYASYIFPVIVHASLGTHLNYPDPYAPDSQSIDWMVLTPFLFIRSLVVLRKVIDKQQIINYTEYDFIKGVSLNNKK